MKISVIVPTLNEERCIAATLDSVTNQPPPFEIIVADGGSADRTVELAEDRALVVTAQRGRASQMNAGARKATGEVYLFLHADTTLPADAFKHVRETLRDPSHVGGCFRLRFDRDTPLLRLYSACTHVRWHRIVFGDRGVFVRASVFDRIGGIPDQPIFEDVDFARSLHRTEGRFAHLPYYVTTASRRFSARGTLRQQAINLVLWTLHLAGVSSFRLARFYPSQSDVVKRR